MVSQVNLFFIKMLLSGYFITVMGKESELSPLTFALIARVDCMYKEGSLFRQMPSHRLSLVLIKGLLAPDLY